MPIPTPEKRERADKFISRCMSSATMVADYPNQKQRFAICQASWMKKWLEGSKLFQDSK